MNYSIYLIFDLCIAFLGVLALGTTNVAVINTTLNESLPTALKIIYPAAFAELFLIIIALSFSMQIESFVNMNVWLQYSIAFYS